MNWFDILKNAGLSQRQRQGISARQKDEDFVFEDEDEDDCYNEFLDIIDKVMASFSNSTIKRWHQGEKSQIATFEYDDFFILVDSIIAEKGKIPDEVYCAAIEMAKIQHRGRKSVRPTSTSSHHKHVGDYFVRSVKNQDVYSILIYSHKEPHSPSLRSTFEVKLNVKNPDDERGYSSAIDTEYSLHQDFDNWRGFF